MGSDPRASRRASSRPAAPRRPPSCRGVLGKAAPPPLPDLSAEPLISRRQVSICTSRPRFMLHISMYSCRWRLMSLFAVASSSCAGREGRRSAREPAPRLCQAGLVLSRARARARASPPGDRDPLAGVPGAAREESRHSAPNPGCRLRFHSRHGRRGPRPVPTSAAERPGGWRAAPAAPGRGTSSCYFYLYLSYRFLILFVSGFEEGFCFVDQVSQVLLLLKETPRGGLRGGKRASRPPGPPAAQASEGPLCRPPPPAPLPLPQAPSLCAALSEGDCRPLWGGADATPPLPRSGPTSGTPPLLAPQTTERSPVLRGGCVACELGSGTGARCQLRSRG